MKAMQSLPEGYREIGSVNLQKEKKTALLINGLALLIAAVMVVVMNFFVPVSSQFQGEKGLLDYFLKPLVLIASLFAYLCLHELVHGIAMKACGTKKVKYGFTGLYAFAASDDYYGKKNISGDRIREARLKKRLTQADLAARIQVEGVIMERDSISRIEKGTRFIPDYEIPVFARVLGVSALWLLGIE